MVSNIPLRISPIPPNLRPEETRIQFADSLINYKNIKDLIFKRYSQRIESKKQGLQNLQQRIIKCQERIENLRGKPDATKIFNKSKYPGGDDFNFPKTTFSIVEQLGDIKKRYHEFQSNFDQLEVSVKQPSAKEYHYSRPMKNVKPDKVGIGGPPANLRSVSNLLLFNKSTQVYWDYQLSTGDETESSGVGLSQEDTQRSSPGDAPHSLSNQSDSGLWIPPRQDLCYMPSLGVVPALDSLPEVLPALEGVAMNSGFVVDSDPSLAPSVMMIDSNLLMELPDIKDNKESDNVVGSLPTLTVGNMVSLENAELPPPPPPPPPPPVNLPPPPPPGPTAPESENPEDKGRNDLLRQIVETGGLKGAKLRNNKTEPVSGRNKSKRKDEDNENMQEADVPLSMLDEMKNRLKRRRLGMKGIISVKETTEKPITDENISNNNNSDDAIGGNVFKKISDKITNIMADKSDSDDDDTRLSKDDIDWSD